MQNKIVKKHVSCLIVWNVIQKIKISVINVNLILFYKIIIAYQNAMMVNFCYLLASINNFNYLRIF